MTRIEAPFLSAPGPRAVCAMLSGAGWQAWFVGGCVRNALIGAPEGDIDIATDAPPAEVMRLADEAGLKPVPTGFDHGTVTVVADGAPHEVTTFRRDVDTDGRRATVAFSDRIEDDARRRDFTMNALYAAPDGTLADPLNGLPDLMARRVRFIDDPGQRIAEDHLRILRFFRFHAWYGDPAGGIDAEGLAACAAALDGIARLSRERVGQEMRKLLAAPDPAPAVAAMAAAGVLAQVLPGASPAALPVLVHAEALLGLAAADPLRRLALLGGEDVAERLRLSRAERARLAALQDGLAGAAPAAVLGYRLGAAGAADVLALRAALGGVPPDPADLAQVRRGAAQVCPVAAADLMPALSGPELGARLKRIEAAWIASDFRATRDALLG